MTAALREVAWRIVVVAAALAAAIGIISVDLAIAPTVVAVVLLVVGAGFATGRWWVMWLPFAGFVGWNLFYLVSEGPELNPNGGELTWEMLVSMQIAVATAVAVVLGLGVWIRDAYNSFSPKNDAKGFALKLPISR